MGDVFQQFSVPRPRVRPRLNRPRNVIGSVQQMPSYQHPGSFSRVTGINLSPGTARAPPIMNTRPTSTQLPNLLDVYQYSYQHPMTQPGQMMPGPIGIHQASSTTNPAATGSLQKPVVRLVNTVAQQMWWNRWVSNTRLSPGSQPPQEMLQYHHQLPPPGNGPRIFNVMSIGQQHPRFPVGISSARHYNNTYSVPAGPTPINIVPEIEILPSDQDQMMVPQRRQTQQPQPVQHAPEAPNWNNVITIMPTQSDDDEPNEDSHVVKGIDKDDRRPPPSKMRKRKRKRNAPVEKDTNSEDPSPTKRYNFRPNRSRIYNDYSDEEEEDAGADEEHSDDSDWESSEERRQHNDEPLDSENEEVRQLDEVCTVVENLDSDDDNDDDGEDSDSGEKIDANGPSSSGSANSVAASPGPGQQQSETTTHHITEEIIDDGNEEEEEDDDDDVEESENTEDDSYAFIMECEDDTTGKKKKPKVRILMPSVVSVGKATSSTQKAAKSSSRDEQPNRKKSSITIDLDEDIPVVVVSVTKAQTTAKSTPVYEQSHRKPGPKTPTVRALLAMNATKSTPQAVQLQPRTLASKPSAVDSNDVIICDDDDSLEATSSSPAASTRRSHSSAMRPTTVDLLEDDEVVSIDDETERPEVPQSVYLAKKTPTNSMLSRTLLSDNLNHQTGVHAQLLFFRMTSDSPILHRIVAWNRKTKPCRFNRYCSMVAASEAGRQQQQREVIAFQCVFCPYIDTSPRRIAAHIRHRHVELTFALSKSTVLPSLVIYLFCRHCSFFTYDKVLLLIHFYVFHSVSSIVLDSSFHPDCKTPSASSTLCNPGDTATRFPFYRCTSCTFTTTSRVVGTNHVASEHANNFSNCFVRLLMVSKPNLAGENALRLTYTEFTTDIRVSKLCKEIYACVRCSYFSNYPFFALAHNLHWHRSFCLVYVCDIVNSECCKRFTSLENAAKHFRLAHHYKVGCCQAKMSATLVNMVDQQPVQCFFEPGQLSESDVPPDLPRKDPTENTVADCIEIDEDENDGDADTTVNGDSVDKTSNVTPSDSCPDSPDQAETSNTVPADACSDSVNQAKTSSTLPPGACVETSIGSDIQKSPSSVTECSSETLPELTASQPADSVAATGDVNFPATTSTVQPSLASPELTEQPVDDVTAATEETSELPPSDVITSDRELRDAVENSDDPAVMSNINESDLLVNSTDPELLGSGDLSDSWPPELSFLDDITDPGSRPIDVPTPPSEAGVGSETAADNPLMLSPVRDVNATEPVTSSEPASSQPAQQTETPKLPVVTERVRKLAGFRFNQPWSS